MPTAGPIVILVGGPPGGGKSTLGTALAAHLGATSLSIDDVVAGARAITDADSHPELFQTHRAGGHVRYFTDGPGARLVEDAERLERMVWRERSSGFTCTSE